jgi:phytoene dehydrogenase-like protein
MSELYDAIVIGAGHNGLTCACYLAKAGLKVLVLEQYRTIGGMTITEEETLPGFWSDIHASGYQLANLSPVPHELGLLDRYELIEPDIPFSHAFPDGNIISVDRDIEETVAAIAGYSRKDAGTWRALMNRFLAEKTPSLRLCFRLRLRSPPPRQASPNPPPVWRAIDSACRVSGHGQTRVSKTKRPKLCSDRSPPFSAHRRTTPVAPNLVGFLRRSCKTWATISSKAE